MRSTASQSPPIPSSAQELTDEDYSRLLALRTSLRRFLKWSEERSAEVGLTPAQHQLLLAVRGHHDPEGPTTGELADYLVVRHHTVVSLVDRAESAGLVQRRADLDDRRVVRIRLSRKGEELLVPLSRLHLEELTSLTARMAPFLEQFSHGAQDHGGTRKTTSPLPPGPTSSASF